MRLSARVLDAVRGMGGAALIAAATGCGASAPADEGFSNVRRNVVVAEREAEPVPQKNEPEPAPETEPDWNPDWPEDAHPACGRG
jgi:hypothetical protein